jgi:ribosomal-protein-alanine N-acetyltransferase
LSLRPANAADIPALARLHALCFETPWTEAALADCLNGAGVLALVAEGPAGLEAILIARVAAGEAEILTLAVDPARRRAGLGMGLVEAAMEAVQAQGADAVFLEVAVDNPAAVGLYKQAGFGRVGTRPRYYPRRSGPPVDALILRRDLTPEVGQPILPADGPD